MQCEKQRQCRRVQVASTQHCTRVSAFSACAKQGLKHRLHRTPLSLGGKCKGRYKRFIRRQAHEQVTPNRVERIVEDAAYNVGPSLPCSPSEFPRLRYSFICLPFGRLQALCSALLL